MARSNVMAAGEIVILRNVQGKKIEQQGHGVEQAFMKAYSTP
jgi:hypothetical protein